MTTADRAAVDALARHFAYEGGGFWEHLDPREQAVYRARALDVVQVVGPIYQAPTTALGKIAAAEYPDTYTPAFPRPMSKETDR